MSYSHFSWSDSNYSYFPCFCFEVLAFPCIQFGGQEPGSNPDIKNFACTKFKVEFSISDKVDVNGPSTAPVHQFRESSAGGLLGDLIKWNSEKFVVDKNGNVVHRYVPTTSPFQIEVGSYLDLFHLSFCLIVNQVLDTVSVSRGCKEPFLFFLTFDYVVHVFVVYAGVCRVLLYCCRLLVSLIVVILDL